MDFLMLVRTENKHANLSVIICLRSSTVLFFFFGLWLGGCGVTNKVISYINHGRIFQDFPNLISHQGSKYFLSSCNYVARSSTGDFARRSSWSVIGNRDQVVWLAIGITMYKPYPTRSWFGWFGCFHVWIWTNCLISSSCPCGPSIEHCHC